MDGSCGRSLGPRMVKKSCGPPVVVLRQTAQSLLLKGTLPSAEAEHFLSLKGFSLHGSVPRTPCRPPQRRLAEQNQPRQTFLFYRSRPPLRVCVQIRTPGWQLQRVYSPGFQHFSKRFANFGVAIMHRRYRQGRRYPNSSLASQFIAYGSGTSWRTEECLAVSTTSGTPSPHGLRKLAFLNPRCLL